jgi:flagellar basal body-associated protein FliL
VVSLVAIIFAVLAVIGGVYYMWVQSSRKGNAETQATKSPSTFKYLGASELIPLNELQNRKGYAVQHRPVVTHFSHPSCTQ